MVELGGWHSHPWGEGQPSSPDIANLVADREEMDIHEPLEVIVRPSMASGWAKPIPACWALVASDDPQHFTSTPSQWRQRSERRSQ